MAKYVRVEMIELPVEQRCNGPTAPVEHFRTARQWWTAGHAAVAAVARRTSSASASGPAPRPQDGGATSALGGTNFRRLVEVPGDQLSDVLSAWWLRAPHDDGHLRLQPPRPVVGGWELAGSLRRRALSRPLPIEVRLVPYAERWSLLELAPRRVTRPSRRYFRIGHGSLDAFVAGLSSFVAADEDVP